MSAHDDYQEVLRAGSDIHHHLPFLFEHAVGNVMEIGVRQGASTSALIAGVEQHGGHVWSVDKADWPLYSTSSPNWTFIRADSIKDAEKIKALIPESLELLLIDGDHDYEAVMSDLENYGDRARVIALHDAEERGVLTAISDYCHKHELDYEVRKHSFGMGVIVRENSQS